ncbi:hypothetical protein Tco_1098398 [Tanacetum coccineum]
MMEADFELAQRLQTEEQGEITIEERSRLFVELMNKRKKHFAMLRAEEKRRKPPTKAQKRNQMSTYLKNMGSTEDELESDKSKKAESSEEKAKGSRKKMLGRKRAGKEQQQESSKKQRMKDDKETDEHEEDDEAELKKHLVIVKDDEITIDAIPLATTPMEVFKRYSSMIRMLQDINREDLQTFWKLVKTKHGDIRPEDKHEKVLWGDFKVMFERNNYEVKLLTKNLNDSEDDMKFREIAGLKSYMDFLELLLLRWVLVVLEVNTSGPSGDLDEAVTFPDDQVNISGPSGELDGMPTLPDWSESYDLNCETKFRSAYEDHVVLWIEL